MHFVDCPLCGSKSKHVLTVQNFKDDYLDMINASYQDIQREIVQCDDCDFIYRSPALDSDDLEILYQKFRDMSIRDETPDCYFDRITSLPKTESENYQKLLWLNKYISDYLPSNGSVLDVGCGGGVFLNTFKEAFIDWNLFGVEPTNAFAELAKRRTSAHVINGNYTSGLFGKTFDLVTCNQVLEHVIDPISFLKELKKDLSSSGVLYLEVPDVSDFTNLPSDHDRFHMQHLSIFSIKTLQHACSSAGFTVIKSTIERTIRGKNNVVVALSPN